MKEIFSKFEKWDWIFVAVASVLYSLLVAKYIPFIDDFIYRFKDVDNGVWERIETFTDVFLCQIDDYQTVNGRFLAHIVIMCFCGFVGSIPFFVISTLVVALLIIGMTYLVRRECSANIIDVPAISLMLLFFPSASLVFLGNIAFVVNYLWGLCLTVWFVAFYLLIWKDKVSFNWCGKIVLSMYAILCGHWQESFSLFLGGALFVYHIIYLKKTRGLALCYLICYGIGILTVLFSPANFNRAIERSSSLGIVPLVESGMMKFLLLFMVLIVLLERKNFVVWMNNNAIFLLSILLSIMFGVVVANKGEHQFTLVSAITIILSYIIVRKHFSELVTKYRLFILISLLLIGVVDYVPIYAVRAKAYDGFRTMEQSIIHPVDKAADSREFELFMEYELPNSLFESFVCPHVKTTYSERYFLMLSHGQNEYDDMCAEVALPDSKKEIVEMCTGENQVVDGMFDYKSNPNFLIIKTDKEHSELSISFKFKPYMFRHKVMCKLQRSRVVERSFPVCGLDFREFIYGGYNYIIVRKPFGLMTDLTNLIEMDLNEN